MKRKLLIAAMALAPLCGKGQINVSSQMMDAVGKGQDVVNRVDGTVDSVAGEARRVGTLLNRDLNQTFHKLTRNRFSEWKITLNTALTTNSFIGPDAGNLVTVADYNDFRTLNPFWLVYTPQGMGSISGLLLIDNFMITGRKLLYPDRRNFYSFTLGIGSITKKFRFEQPLIFDARDGNLTVYPDDDPAHGYASATKPIVFPYFTNDFWSNRKSKLTLTYLRLSASAGAHLWNEKVSVELGTLVDIYLFGKHKRIYEENNERQYAYTQGSEMPIEPLQLGFFLRLGYKRWYVDYHQMVTPMFDANRGPEVYARGVTLGRRLSLQRRNNQATNSGVNFRWNKLKFWEKRDKPAGR